jgi:PAS domain S-box-containing protein/putative nucleotidyltransferase with HDIG domain
MEKDNRPCQVKTRTDESSNALVDLSGLHGIPTGFNAAIPINLRTFSEEELLMKSQLLDLASDAIFLHDLKGQFIYVNEACHKLTGYDKNELLRINAYQLTVNKNAVDLNDRYKELSEKGELIYESNTQRKDGSPYCIEVHSRIIEVSGKKCIFNTARNITQRKEAEKALQNSYTRLQKTLDGFIGTIATMSETRDPYTAGHQKQVSRLAQAIAGEMQLDGNTCESIRVAGVLHDIGKLSIPAEILSKPGKLSTAEFAIIKRHPEVGCDILKTIEFPWPICGIVSQHHERLDGSGYPSGLKGDDICLEARILAVADVVEAMASHRPYRPSLGIDVALDEVVKNKGTKYDMGAVDACVRLVNNGGFALY